MAGFLDDTKRVGETVLECPVLGGFDLLKDAAFVPEPGSLDAITAIMSTNNTMFYF